MLLSVRLFFLRGLFLRGFFLLPSGEVAFRLPYPPHYRANCECGHAVNDPLLGPDVFSRLSIEQVLADVANPFTKRGFRHWMYDVAPHVESTDASVDGNPERTNRSGGSPEATNDPPPLAAQDSTKPSGGGTEPSGKPFAKPFDTFYPPLTKLKSHCERIVHGMLLQSETLPMQRLHDSCESSKIHAKANPP